MLANAVLNNDNQSNVYDEIFNSLGEPEQLKSLLSQLTEEQYLQIAEKPNSVDKNKTIFHYAIDNPKSLEILLNRCPIKKRFTMVTTYSHVLGSVYSVLDTASRENNSRALKVILDSLPELADWEAAKVYPTWLCEAAQGKYLGSLETLLTALPQNKRLEMIEKGGAYNNSVPLLWYGIDNPSILLIILESLPEAQRVEVAQKKNKSDRTGFQKAALSPLFKCVLETLPENKRLEIARKENTVIQNVDKMEALVSCLPESQHIEAIQAAAITNAEKANLLGYAIRLQKQYCNDFAIKDKTDAILRLVNSPVLEKKPEIRWMILEDTHKLLEGKMQPKVYNQQAEVILGNPHKLLQIIGGLMIALGMLVAIAAAATLIAAPVLPVVTGGAVIGGVVGAGVAGFATWHGISFFNKGTNPYIGVSDAMRELSNDIDDAKNKVLR